jgi:hypothetical protein
VEDCACGAPRRKFWIWRDGNDVLHASAFAPTTGGVRAVIAATARDALLAVTGNGTPKHQVHDADAPSQVWEGRCQASMAAAAS